MATTDSKTDWIPILSQLKSAVEFIGGDRGGAAYTHQQFLKRCPILCQTAAGIGLKNANSSISSANAESVQIFSNLFSALPVIGHLKSCYHLIFKDNDSAVDAVLASTRSASILTAGYFGKQFGGFPTAIGSAFATGFLFDLFGTTVAQKPFGMIFMIKTAVNYPSPGAIFDTFAVSLADCLTGALIPTEPVAESALFIFPAAILGSISAPMIEPPPVKYFEEIEGTASTVMTKFLNSDFAGSKESLFTSYTEDSETNTSYNPSPAPDLSGDVHSLEINDNLNSSSVMDINQVFTFLTSEVDLLDPATKKFQRSLVSMIEMPPKYFVYTGVFKFEDVHRGALNLVLRHGIDLERIVPDFKLDNLSSGARKLIRHMQNCPDSKAKEILISLDKMMKQNSKMHNELIHLQMILFDFLTDSIMEENYMGEYRDHRGRSRSAWKIINKLEQEQCMLTHLGYYSHKPNAVIPREFREVSSVQFISIDEAKRSAVKHKTKLT